MIARPSFLMKGLLVGVAAASCATTGSTFQSGVGETMIEHPPYYSGKGARAVTKIGHVPIVYQSAAEQSAMFDPGRSPAMINFLHQMNDFLDSLGVSARLVIGTPTSGAQRGSMGTPPDVQFGCLFDPGFDDECRERGDSALGRSGQRMRLAVARPSRTWIDSIGRAMDEQQVSHNLVITLEVGQYLIRQRGFRGRKELELGTGYVVRFPWLTSLETPVSVVQLTGALVGRDGKAVRIGAEGLLARRTSLPMSSLGFQALIREDDVAELSLLRREDLPGTPLTWQVGLRALVTQLVGGT